MNQAAHNVHDSFNPTWRYSVRWIAVAGYGGNRVSTLLQCTRAVSILTYTIPISVHKVVRTAQDLPHGRFTSG